MKQNRSQTRQLQIAYFARPRAQLNLLAFIAAQNLVGISSATFLYSIATIGPWHYVIR